MDSRIQLFQTPPTQCPYLAYAKSSNFIVDPTYKLTPEIYDFLLDNGFRRSAGMVYRPACPACQECKSTRIPVSLFHPNRSQRRALQKVQNEMTVDVLPAELNDEQYELYKKYTLTRHPDSDMSNSSKSQIMDFLKANWSHTLLVEIRVKNQLFAIAVTDRQPRSLSALYTFFDPDKSHLSPGVVSILTQIRLAREYNLDWLYLGYWIESSPKMSYKINYRPIQYLDEGHWHLLER